MSSIPLDAKQDSSVDGYHIPKNNARTSHNILLKVKSVHLKSTLLPDEDAR